PRGAASTRPARASSRVRGWPSLSFTKKVPSCHEAVTEMCSMITGARQKAGVTGRPAAWAGRGWGRGTAGQAPLSLHNRIFRRSTRTLWERACPRTRAKPLPGTGGVGRAAGRPGRASRAGSEVVRELQAEGEIRGVVGQADRQVRHDGQVVGGRQGHADVEVG